MHIPARPRPGTSGCHWNAAEWKSGALSGPAASFYRAESSKTGIFMQYFYMIETNFP
jgi:hypothetical protein